MKGEGSGEGPPPPRPSAFSLDWLEADREGAAEEEEGKKGIKRGDGSGRVEEAQPPSQDGPPPSR